MQDFTGKFEGDFNFLVNFFFKYFLHKIEVDFFLYCPLPYSLPSGSSANLTARRGAPSLTGGRVDGWTGGRVDGLDGWTGWTGWTVIKSVL